VKVASSLNTGELGNLSGLISCELVEDMRNGFSDGLAGLRALFDSDGGDDAGEEDWVGRNGPEGLARVAPNMSFIRFPALVDRIWDADPSTEVLVVVAARTLVPQVN